MGQKPFKPLINQQPSIPLSRPITDQQTSLHILALHKELFTRIALFMDAESQLALVYTCSSYWYFSQSS
jgi:hypothetical protein